MEDVEEFNKAAVGSCHRVLNLISQPKDQAQFRNLTVETVDAVSKFRRVISKLDGGVGHARVRKAKKLNIPLPQNILLDAPSIRVEKPSRSLNLIQPFFPENPIKDAGSNPKSCLSLGNPNLELNSTGKVPLQLGQQTPTPHYQFLSQQHQQRLQLHQQQQMKQQQHVEMMYRRTNSGVNLSFDSSSCAPSMSSARSFMSSLSMDGSVTNLDGSAFHLIGGPQTSDQRSLQHKRKCYLREDGSAKCLSSSGKCHCSRKRKHRVKRSIKVPAISNKLADIPPDDYSWRKYGQKPIKGSPYPRGYYKCSSMRGCPARKHVERCTEEPTMLMVTYESEHNHPKLPIQSANP